MSMMFENGVQTAVADQLVDLGSGYVLPWITAIALAGRPLWQSVQFAPNQARCLPLFGGGLVAVEQPFGGNRVWWPVTDAEGQAKPWAQIDGWDLVRATDRARGFAVALEHGVGLCGLAGERRADAFVARVQAAAAAGDASLKTDWVHAYAAARLRCPELSVRVESFGSTDPQCGPQALVPVRQLDGQWQVTLCLNTRRRLLRVSEPLLPGCDDQQVTPSVTDWHGAVLRALGYGSMQLMQGRAAT